MCSCSACKTKCTCNSKCPGYPKELLPVENKAVAPKPVIGDPIPSDHIATFTERNLWPVIPGKRFNSSLIGYGDGYLLAFRTGWEGSAIHLVKMDADFKPLDVIKLRLEHADAPYGREDPRLFWYDGDLHVSFAGLVVKRRGKQRIILYVHILYARLNDQLEVESVYRPKLEKRNDWEKNWVFFEYGEKLYSIYSTAPHKILEHNGADTKLAYETGSPLPWNLPSEIRGGAAPILVDNEWWHFFHSRVGEGAKAVYCMGVLTFENKPPFRITRIIPDPIKWADAKTKPPDMWCPVIFPCGVVFDKSKNRFIVSMGIHDRWTEIHAWDKSELEAKMDRVAPPEWWACRDFPYNDRDIFADVVKRDEYGLKYRTFSERDTVLDIGAHVGSFAYAVKCRGNAIVHCYEPVESNLVFLKHNAEQMPNVSVFDAAVLDTAGEAEVKTHPNDPNNTGGGHIVPGMGTLVVAFDDAVTKLSALSPTSNVTLCKLDCEGGEFAIILNSKKLTWVTEFVGEFHSRFGDPNELWTRLDKEGYLIETTATADGRGTFKAVKKFTAIGQSANSAI